MKIKKLKEENENENENENESENENEDEKTMTQYEKNEIIKDLNDKLDEIIGKSKLFEEQIESLKKLEGLKEYYPYNDYDGKELKSKYFKIEFADMSNEIAEKLCEQIVDHILETLANKLINTTNKEENQIIVNYINKNYDKLFEMDEFYDILIQPSDRRVNLILFWTLIKRFN